MGNGKLADWAKEVKKGFGSVGRHRPSPAMVVALIALAISMGTSAYAAIKIPNNSVGTAQLKNNAVTAKKIKKGSVTKAKIARASVTSAALAARSVSANAVQSGAIGRAALAKLAIGPEQIDEGAVEEGKIKDEAVVRRSIADGAVGSNEIQDEAIGSGKIQNGAVGSGKIQDEAIGSGKIKDGAVGSVKIEEAAVGLGKIQDGAVGPGKIANGAVGTPNISSGSITAGKLADDSVGVGALQALPSARKTVDAGETQSIASGTPFPVDVNYPTTVFDNGGLIPDGNDVKLVATEAGIYDFSANATWDAHNVGTREISVWKTIPGFIEVSSRIASQRVPAIQGGVTPITLAGTVSMNAGEFLVVRAYQDSGGPLGLVSTQNNIPTFSLTYLSPAN